MVTPAAAAGVLPLFAGSVRQNATGPLLQSPLEGVPRPAGVQTPFTQQAEQNSLLLLRARRGALNQLIINQRKVRKKCLAAH